MSEFDLPPGAQCSIEPFNIEAEYVPDPLLPDGTYKGIITKVELKPDVGILEFTAELQGNEGIFCVDGITPADGKTSRFALWLLQKGDELVKSQFSSLTKRQEGIRTIKRFREKMKIEIGSEQDIIHAIESQEWLSIPVFASVKSRPNNGILYNYIKKLERATS